MLKLTPLQEWPATLGLVEVASAIQMGDVHTWDQCLPQALSTAHVLL